MRREMSAIRNWVSMLFDPGFWLHCLYGMVKNFI